MKNLQIPNTGLKGLKENLKDDLIAGFSVSLIALPLCLGIALASGVPPMAGIVAAILGSIIASRLGGTYVTISGPAAGLIVVTLGAVESLGQGDVGLGYSYALAAIVIGGIVMGVFGLLKFGKLGNFFPTSAVHGMLAAIGIIIILKQFFVAIGAPVPKGDILTLIREIPNAAKNFNPEIAYIGLVSISILIVQPMIDKKHTLIHKIPAPIWALLFTIPLDLLFNVFEGHNYSIMGDTFHIGPEALVHLPDHFFGKDSLQFPNFGKIAYGAFWVAVAGFALVSAIESLLSAKAVDSLDPFRRESNYDKDLVAMGFGSSLAGLFGGLPIISEIVRSSANINSGAKTSWSNVYHGVFLFIFVIFGKPIIDMIPLSALAAMLVYTGFKLASPREFIHVYKISKSEFLVFVSTTMAVLLTDLIIGIGVGIIVNLLVNYKYGLHVSKSFKIAHAEEFHDNVATIKLSGGLVFSNFLSLEKLIKKHFESEKLILDFEEVELIDHSVTSHLENWSRKFAQVGKQLVLANRNHLCRMTNHPLSGYKRSHDSENNFVIENRADFFQTFIRKFGWSLDEDFDLNEEIWRQFPSISRNELMHVSHTGTWWNTQGDKFVIADLVVNKLMGYDKYINVFVLKLNLGETIFPQFAVSKESFSEKLFETMDFQDIKISIDPNFSATYTIKGAIPEDVIELFTNHELIDCLMDNQQYTLESKGSGRGILIYTRNDITNGGELLELLHFSEKLSAILNRNVLSKL